MKEKAIVRDERSYMPVRMLQRLGIGDVEWIPKNKEIRVSVAPELMPPVQVVRFRIGKANLFGDDGNPFSSVATPAPFLEGGQTYLPLQPFRMLGVSVEMKKPYLELKWTEKQFEVYRPEIVSERQELRFTVLYETDLYDPMVLRPFVGGWTGSSEGRKLLETGIQEGERTYKRMQFTVKLQPGVNPIILNSDGFGRTTIEAYWTPKKAEDVPFEANVYEPVVFDSPQHGYVVANEGETIPIEGTITSVYPLGNEISIQFERYDPATKWIVSFGEPASIPIVDQRFEGSFPAPAAGEYTVRIYSPPHIPTPQGWPAPTEWGRFVLKVVAPTE